MRPVYHAVTIDKPHPVRADDQLAERIYAKTDPLTDADYDLLISINRELPQDRAAKVERNPAVKHQLECEARDIRFQSRQRKAAKERAEAQAEYDRQEAYEPEPQVEPDLALRDAMYAILHDDNASEKAKCEARATLWANKLKWPEQELHSRLDPFAKGELGNKIARIHRQLVMDGYL